MDLPLMAKASNKLLILVKIVSHACITVVVRQLLQSQRNIAIRSTGSTLNSLL